MLSPLGGVPVVVRSVRAMLACGADVIVSAPVWSRAPVAQACAELPVTVVGSVSDLVGMIAQRTVCTGSDARVTNPGFVLVHDAARPLAPADLTHTVLDSARGGHRLVVPVLPLADTVKTLDANCLVQATPDRAGLRVVQTPQAVAADLVPRVLAAAVDNPVQGWAAAGEAVHTVVGHPRAFPVHRAWDLELAESMEGADR